MEAEGRSRIDHGRAASRYHNAQLAGVVVLRRVGEVGLNVGGGHRILRRHSLGFPDEHSAGRVCDGLPIGQDADALRRRLEAELAHLAHHVLRHQRCHADTIRVRCGGVNG